MWRVTGAACIACNIWSHDFGIIVRL